MFNTSSCSVDNRTRTRSRAADVLRRKPKFSVFWPQHISEFLLSFIVTLRRVPRKTFAPLKVYSSRTETDTLVRYIINIRARPSGIPRPARYTCRAGDFGLSAVSSSNFSVMIHSPRFAPRDRLTRGLSAETGARSDHKHPGKSVNVTHVLCIKPRTSVKRGRKSSRRGTARFTAIFVPLPPFPLRILRRHRAAMLCNVIIRPARTRARRQLSHLARGLKFNFDFLAASRDNII